MATWKHGAEVEDAGFEDNLEEYWECFQEWVESLPDGAYPHLQAFAETAILKDRIQTGLELVAAWKALPNDYKKVRGAVESLVSTLEFRMVLWARRHDYAPPPDPAELHLNLEEDE